jgi:hypothetical protein
LLSLDVVVSGQPSLLFGALKLPSQDQKLLEYIWGFELAGEGRLGILCVCVCVCKEGAVLGGSFSGSAGSFLVSGRIYIWVYLCQFHPFMKPSLPELIQNFILF